MKLSEILSLYGSDKSNAHSYGVIYDELFAPFHYTATAVLEFGVYAGASMRAWHAWFKNTLIVGVDLAVLPCPDTRLPPDRYQPIVADQKDQASLAKIADFGPYDIVVDDGCHDRVVQESTFAVVYPMVKPGGLYIIEDVQSHVDAWEMAPKMGGALLDLRPFKGRHDDIMLVWRKP